MYAFFLDIDGTMFDGKTVTDGVITAIKHAQSLGHKVFVNTARAYIGMPRPIQEIPFDGFINSFGLEIVADGRFLHRHFMPRETVLAIAQYALSNQLKLFFEGEQQLGIHWKPDFDFCADSVEKVVRILTDFRFCKAVLDPHMPAEQKDVLSALAVGYRRICNELIVEGYDKTYGMKILCEHYGISQADTVAVGDSAPDMEMLSYAGIGICMGNGTQALKDAASFITRSVKEDGVAYAIDCVLNGRLDALQKS